MRWGGYQLCTGQVECADDTGITIRMAPAQPVSEQCGGCRACGAGTRRTPVRVHLPPGEPLRLSVGQTVTVRRFVVNPALAAATVFGLPLGFMLAGLAVGSLTLDRAANTPVLLVWALAGLVAGALLAWLVQRAIDRRTGRPRIIPEPGGP